MTTEGSNLPKCAECEGATRPWRGVDGIGLKCDGCGALVILNPEIPDELQAQRLRKQLERFMAYTTGPTKLGKVLGLETHEA